MAEGDNNTPEEEKEVTQQKQEQLDIIKDMNDALQKQVQYQVKLSRLKGEEVSEAQRLSMLYGEQAEASKELLELATSQEVSVDNLLDLHGKYNDILDNEVKKGRMLAENAEKQKEVADQILTLKAEMIANAASENKEAEELLEVLTKQLSVEQKKASARQSGASAGANLVNSMGSLIGMKPSPALNDFFKNMQSGAGKQGFAGFLEGVGTQVGEVFSLGNVLGFVTSNMIELGIAFDSVVSETVAATGASRDYGAQINSVANDIRGLGLGFEYAGRAQVALLADFPKFTELVTETGARNIALQNELTKTAAQLSKLGVDASVTADNFTFLVSSLGMTGDQANNTFRTMMEQGANLGIPPQQLGSALANLQPKLALFGARAPDIFMKTAAAAKDLGLSVDELGSNLFQLSDGLDEFDEAASKVAAFNLTLGGSFVDTFELVTAAAEGPFAQVEILQQGLARAGKTLGGLSFREKQFMAKNFGMEIDTLTQIMDGQIRSQEELDKVQKENSKTIEDMVRDATPVLEDLAASLQGVLEPLGDILAPIADGLNTISSALGDAFGPAVLGVVAVSVGRFAAGLRQAKLEASGMAANIANVATQLKLLGLQAQKSKLDEILENEALMLEEIKRKFPGIQEGTKEFGYKGVEAMESVMATSEELGSKIQDISESLEGTGDAASKAGGGLKGMGLGGIIEMAGTAYSVFSLLNGVLGGLDSSTRIAAGGFLILAAAAAAFAIAKYAVLTTPFGAIAAGAALGAGIAGIAGVISGISEQNKASVTPIGSLEANNATSFAITGGVDDAIIRNDGQKTKVTPINKNDQLIAAKPGGPIAAAVGGSGGVPERLIAALETIAAGMRRPSANNSTGAVNVTVELDKRKMGQAVVDIMNKEMSLT